MSLAWPSICNTNSLMENQYSKKDFESHCTYIHKWTFDKIAKSHEYHKLFPYSLMATYGNERSLSKILHRQENSQVVAWSFWVIWDPYYKTTRRLSVVGHYAHFPLQTLDDRRNLIFLRFALLLFLLLISKHRECKFALNAKSVKKTSTTVCKKLTHIWYLEEKDLPFSFE